MSVKNLIGKTDMDQFRSRCKSGIRTCMIYSFIAVFATVSFLFVFFTILPAVNGIGLAAFGQNEVVLLSYGIMPFICIDMCIVQGYFFVLRKAARKISCFYKTGRVNSHG